jgi:hypothetical protein
MINWDKLQPKYERITYRIVQKHISKILGNIRLNNASFATYEILISSNINKEDIFKMFVEIYQTIGFDYANRLAKDLAILEKKDNVLFNENLLREIVLYLQSNGGVKITSVSETLADDIIKAIKAQLGQNATVVDLQRVILNIVNKTQTFYRFQALRIARTETTAASGFAAIQRAKESNLVLIKEWISVNDNRTRLDHRLEQGQKVDLDEPFIMSDKSELQYPGDINGTAKQVINCRCTIAFSGKRDAEGNLMLKN